MFGKISSHTVKASKEYSCMAYDWIVNGDIDEYPYHNFESI